MEPKIVADLMSSDVVTLDQNDELSHADDIMKLGRVRHLPVLDEDGAVVGVVSQRDLYYSALMKALGHGSRAVGKTLGAIRVKEAMNAKPEIVTPQTPIGEAARTMSRRKIGCLLVVEDGELKGILTEGDFVAHFASS